MNLKEGTRRLALLLGVAGAIVGGFASYAELQSVMRQRADNQRFEQLANSGLVQEAKNWITLAPEQRDKAQAQMTPEHKSQLAKALGMTSGKTPTVDPPNDWQTASKSKVYLDDNGNPIAAQAAPAPRVDSTATLSDVGEIDKDGIENVRWTRDHKIESLKTQDGQTLYPTPAPGPEEYLLTVILPLLGYFVPWSTIRAIGWVGAGFVASSK